MLDQFKKYRLKRKFKTESFHQNYCYHHPRISLSQTWTDHGSLWHTGKIQREKTNQKSWTIVGGDLLNLQFGVLGFLTIIGLSDHGSLWPRKLAQNSNEGHNMSLGQNF